MSVVFDIIMLLLIVDYTGLLPIRKTVRRLLLAHRRSSHLRKLRNFGEPRGIRYVHGESVSSYRRRIQRSVDTDIDEMNKILGP